MPHLDAGDWIAMVLGSTSFVVAIIALVYARQSALSAAVSAKSAEVSSDLDLRPRHEERTPEWHAELEPAGRGLPGPHRLRLELVTPETMEEVTVVALEPDLLKFRDNQEGVDERGDRAESVRPVRPNRRDDAVWMVEVAHPSPGGTTRLEVTAARVTEPHDTSARWVTTLDVELPRRPGRTSQARITG